MSDHIPDVTKMISDTPRTDKAWKTTHSVYEFTVEMKRMERELNAANDRIMLLEEAGISAIHEAIYGREDDALEIWRKAMEAKP